MKMVEIGTSLLSGLSDVSSISGHQNTTGAKQSAGSGFADVLSDMLEQYRQVDNEGDYASLNLLSGKTEDLSGALIATEKAEIALSLTVAVRNKAVDAYKEIMSMQV